mgnify:CR=1 FL=1
MHRVYYTVVSLILPVVYRCDNHLNTETSCSITQEDSYEDINSELSLPEEKCDFTVKPPGEEAASLMSHYHIDNVSNEVILLYQLTKIH